MTNKRIFCATKPHRIQRVVREVLTSFGKSFRVSAFKSSAMSAQNFLSCFEKPTDPFLDSYTASIWNVAIALQQMLSVVLLTVSCDSKGSRTETWMITDNRKWHTSLEDWGEDCNNKLFVKISVRRRLRSNNSFNLTPCALPVDNQGIHEFSEKAWF